MSSSWLGSDARSLDRSRRRSFADHFRRDALADLALRVSVVEQRVLGVSVHVDEAGRDHLAGGVDDARGLRAVETPDSRNMSSANSHIGLDPRISRPVDDMPASNDDVVGLRRNAWANGDQNGEEQPPKFWHGEPPNARGKISFSQFRDRTS